jgi:hypothetical protein
MHAEIRKAKNDAYFLDVTSESYAGSVMVSFDGGDIFPEDNFFDITDGKVSIALRGSASEIEKSKISIISLYDVT